MRAMRRARSRRVVGAVLVALVVAGGALRLAASSDPGHRLFPDEQSYGRLATGLAERGDYGDPRLGDRTRWAPGAPVAFAAAERLLPAGRASQPHEVPAARTAQALIGTLMIPAAFGLAALIAGHGAGLAAAAAIALFPPLITVSRYQISEPLAALLVLLGMLALAKACARGAARAGWAAAAGALLGLAVLTRADLLLPVLVAGPALWLVTRRTAGVRPAAALTAGVLVVILPWSRSRRSTAGSSCRSAAAGPARCSWAPTCRARERWYGFKARLGRRGARARFADLRDVDPLRDPGRARAGRRRRPPPGRASRQPH